MNQVQLTGDQRDALQELANIAMGQAGAALARILDTMVTLSIPRIQVVEATSIDESLRAMMGGSDNVTGVRQSYRCDVEGEALVVYGQDGCAVFSDMLGHDSSDQRSGSTARELLFDVSNILIGACVGNIFQQLGRSLTFSAPSLVAQNVPLENLLHSGSLPWSMALLLEVNLSLEDRSFTCHLLTFMPESSIQIVQRALDKFLNSL